MRRAVRYLFFWHATSVSAMFSFFIARQFCPIEKQCIHSFNFFAIPKLRSIQISTTNQLLRFSTIIFNLLFAIFHQAISIAKEASLFFIGFQQFFSTASFARLPQDQSIHSTSQYRPIHANQFVQSPTNPINLQPIIGPVWKH